MRKFHRRMFDHRSLRDRFPRGLYRSRSGMLLGVCKGLAQYFDFSLTAVRLITVIAFIFTGFWPVGMLYLLAALVMRPEPVVHPVDEADEEFYRSYANDRTMALGRLKRTYQNLEKRLHRLEDSVTRREFDWDSRVNQ